MKQTNRLYLHANILLGRVKKIATSLLESQLLNPRMGHPKQGMTQGQVAQDFIGLRVRF